MLVPSQDELGDYGMKGIWHKNAEDDKGGSTGEVSWHSVELLVSSLF